MKALLKWCIRKILLVWLVVGFFLALVYFFSESLLPPFSNFLDASEDPANTEAIVVLLGASQPDRILKAKELYSAGKAPLIIFGTGFSDSRLDSIKPDGLIWPAASMRYIIALESLGVPRESIRLVSTEGDFDTSSELTSIGNYARENKIESLILVSSKSHTRRIKIIWNRVNSDIASFVVGAEAPGFDRWWEHGHLIRSIGYEYTALIKELYRQIKNKIPLDLAA